MLVRSLALGFTLIAAAILAVATAADPPPQPRPCRELTGEERTRCEQQASESDPSRATPPPKADEKEPPPPDTKSESDQQSDTADPPQA